MFKNIRTIRAGRAALAAFLLALPVGVLYPSIVFKIQPFYSLYRTYLTVDGSQASLFGMAVLFAMMALLPFAFVINLIPIVRDMRRGGDVTDHPLNVALAVIIFVLIIMTWGGLIEVLV